MGDLRIAFAAPTLPFVIGASGMDGRSSGSGGRRDELCEAQRRATLRAPFVGSTLFVETRDYARSSGSPNPNQARSVRAVLTSTSTHYLLSLLAYLLRAQLAPGSRAFLYLSISTHLCAELGLPLGLERGVALPDWQRDGRGCT